MEDLTKQAGFEQANKEFHREVAIAQARPLIYKVAIILWILFDLVLIGLLVFVVVGYLVYGQFSDRRSTADLSQNLSLIHANAADRSAGSLLVDDSFVLGSEGSYDFVAELTNPNEDWFAEFSYSFAGASGETSQLSGFIFPGETKYLIALNEDIEGSMRGAEINVSNLKWTRMDGHLIENRTAWYQEHSNFSITGIAHGIVEVGGKQIVRSTFTVTNSSPYQYWSAPFILVLKRNGVPIGVNQVSLAGLEVGETRTVNVNWFDNTPSSGDLIIESSINFLDENAYMLARSETEVDVRDAENR